MSAIPYLSKEQIAAAREMDLLTYLRRFEPEELVHIGGNTYTTRTHDSLKISNGKWCWWSRNIGGTNALDYLTRVEGLSFLDAVQRILGELPRVPPKSEPTAPLPKTEFTLPPKHADNRRVFAYLRSRGIDAEIINIHTIKPLDEELVLASAAKTGKVVTIEEHSVIGGLGSAVCDVLSEKQPTKVMKIGINDVFGESGPALELIQKYGLDAQSIYEKVKAFVKQN